MNHEAIEFHRILVPTDFSEFAGRAVDYALRLPRAADFELLLAHAIEPTIYPVHQVIQRQDELSIEQQVRKTCDERLGDMQREIGARARVRTLVLHGHPASELVAAAELEKVDLIVIATHGRTGIKHLLLGSTAENVVRRAPCPVLTVRHEFAN